MSLADLPDELIAHISSYANYSDVLTLMETNKRNYGMIKRLGMDKIKLKRLEFSHCDDVKEMIVKVTEITGKRVYHKDSNRIKGEADQIRRIIGECKSIEVVSFGKVDFTSEICMIFLDSNVNIGANKSNFQHIYVVSNKMLISAEELLKFCQKFCKHSRKPLFRHLEYDPAIWTDEVQMELVGWCHLQHNSYPPIGSPSSPLSITDRTLTSLIRKNEIETDFDIGGVHNYITVMEIVKAIEMVTDRELNYLNGSLGILQPEEAADAERYFGKDGVLSKKFSVGKHRGSNGDHPILEYEVSYIFNSLQKKFYI